MINDIILKPIRLLLTLIPVLHTYNKANVPGEININNNKEYICLSYASNFITRVIHATLFKQ